MARQTQILQFKTLEVVDYSSHADVSRDPGHYVIFWELNADANDDVLQACCDELDRSPAPAIGALELRVLQRGTFQKVLRHYLSLGAPVSQFKSNSGVLQILSGNVVKARRRRGRPAGRRHHILPARVMAHVMCQTVSQWSSVTDQLVVASQLSRVCVQCTIRSVAKWPPPNGPKGIHDLSIVHSTWPCMVTGAASQPRYLRPERGACPGAGRAPAAAWR
ncbi:hypothetical protein HU200_066683 [Digitaria exilis]|uniref:GH3 C-terminal domain-containing protein n=1 Tax=Digitaria exilis TaxID=1010633 RepID=A0A835DWT7_9POAL|nr:hypothetical protein HU200_066683 [Digitaria exilis]